VSIALAAALLTSATAAQAQPAATPFPAGKSVSIHVGTDPGGTNDLLMRLVAKHIGKYLPGRPSVVPRNMPGAGGKRLATHLYNAAPRDGTELGVIQRSVTTDQLLVDPTLPFRMQELTWIGTPTGTTDTCIVWHKAKVQSLADLQMHELVLAGTGNETTQVLILQRLTGGKIRVVLGYPGGASMNIAMERGEADGRCALSWEAIKSNYGEWLRDKKLKVLAQYALTRAPDLPDVPLITELAAGIRLPIRGAAGVAAGGDRHAARGLPRNHAGPAGDRGGAEDQARAAPGRRRRFAAPDPRRPRGFARNHRAGARPHCSGKPLAEFNKQRVQRSKGG
jgi:tripartite-type tricarboxylate transporter receptor subunit TctC